MKSTEKEEVLMNLLKMVQEEFEKKEFTRVYARNIKILLDTMNNDFLNYEAEV